MAISLSNAAKDAVNDALVDLLDAGAGANGQIIVKDGAAVLATLDLDAPPAFGASAAGVVSALNLPKSATATGTGVADSFDAVDRDGTVGLFCHFTGLY